MRIQTAGAAVRVAHQERVRELGARPHISSVHFFCLDAHLLETHPRKGSLNLWSVISWLEAQETTWTLYWCLKWDKGLVLKD